MKQSWRTLAAAGALACTGFGQALPPEADLLIRGGTVYPGGGKPFRGDVLIRGDHIVYVGPRAPGGAAKVIDATGLIVAPGFIDPHTHADAALASRDPAARLVLPFLTQGVTTAFIGVDGGGDPDVARTLGVMAGNDAGSVFGQTTRDQGSTTPPTSGWARCG